MTEALVLTQPCAQCHPTPLTPLASMSQPAAMGRDVGWLSKSGEESHGTARIGQILAMAEGRGSVSAGELSPV